MEVEEKLEFKVLKECLLENEIEQIPIEIGSKLEDFFQEKFDSFITAKALFETQRKSTDSSLHQLLQNDQLQKLELKESFANLDLTKKYISELQHQLNDSRSHVLNISDSFKRLEKDNAELRKYKVMYTDENNMLHSQIGRRNNELERLRAELTSLSVQLQSAITEKCKAYAQMEEIHSKEISIDLREKHFEQEREFLFQKVASFEEELCKRTAESQNSRSESSARLLILQTRLSQCEEELKITNDHMIEIRESNSKLQCRSEELTQKLEEQRNHELTMHASYREEVTAQTRLSDLYKSMSDEANAKANEYSEAIKELQSLLDHATKQYGLLEVKHHQSLDFLNHEIAEKQEKINELSKELNLTNELLKTVKQDRLNLAVEELAPTAAITSRILKKGLSLTQIYTQLVENINDLNLEREENEKLRSQMEVILTELEEKAPVLQKQREDFESVSAEISNLTARVDVLLIENHKLVENNNEIQKSADHYLRENKKLKLEQADLARQVCYLLKEIQDNRETDYSINDVGDSNIGDLTSSQIISKKLVTFKNIEDLQKNNQKLLSIVRTLSSRQEEIEKATEEINSGELNKKLERYIEQLTGMQRAQDRQSKMLENLSKQRDMYKNMYHQLVNHTPSSGEFLESFSEQMEESSEPAGQFSHKIKQLNQTNQQIIDKKNDYFELEKKFQEVNNSFELYKKEKLSHEQYLNSEIERLRRETEISSNRSCQLQVKLDTVNERFNLLQNNVITYKTQIKILEEKCATYNVTIGKHEQSLMILKDEAMSAEARLSKAEVQLENLRQERQLLRDSESRLIKEREVLHRERQTHALLKADVESIKISLERVQSEGQFIAEKQLNDVTRECSALRRRLQEEQDRFRDLSVKLENRVTFAEKRLAEEKLLTDKIQSELTVSHTAEQNYIKNINDLESKLKELSSHATQPVSDNSSRNKLKNLETQLKTCQTEIQSLMDQLKAARFQSQQYCDIAESAELQLRETTDQFEKIKEKIEKKITAANGQIILLKTKIEELEDKVQKCPIFQLQNDFELKKKLDLSSQTIEQLKVELETTVHELKLASLAAATAEDKYAREMVLHSTDLQSLAKLKEETQCITKSMSERMQKEISLRETLALEKSMLLQRENLHQKEITELQQRVKELDSQNILLHDQIQELSERAVIVSNQKVDTPDFSSSSLDADCSNEEYSKSMEQMFQVIKFVRREKDLALTKLDVLKTENVRLKSQIELNNKQLKEVQDLLNKERENRDINIVTVAKHTELLRKIETLNAITDSNRILREERDALIDRIKDFTEKINHFEAEITPLREKSKILEEKNEVLSQENNTLKNETQKWRQRANSLIDRANKASPEDWRRLQMERENLSKLLTSERESHIKEMENFNAIKNENAQLMAEVKQLQDERKSYEDKVNKMTEDITKLSQDLNVSNAELIKKEKELLHLQKELENKETIIADVKNKEIQIRKIAKKYKTQYEELSKNVEDKFKLESNLTCQGNSTKSANDDEALTVQDKDSQLKEENVSELKNISNLSLKIDELNQQISSKQNECERLYKEIEIINKSSLEKEERAKQVLKGARTKIMQLTEYKKLCEKEINELKEKLDSNTNESESSVNEYEARLTALKSQMDGRISRLEHDRLELLSEKENLHQKILQLQRNLSGSNSMSVGSSDPPTANIKPMSARTETPLASIRPMSVVVQSRTAAVLPTTAGAPLLLTTQSPQQQLVHTTEISSPTSSHVDYQPASTSRQLIVQPQPNDSAESTQHDDLETIDNINVIQQQSQPHQPQQIDQPQQEHQLDQQQPKQSSEQINVHHHQQQQSQQQHQQQQLNQPTNQLTVALVSPRIEQQQPSLLTEQTIIPSSSTQSVTTSQLMSGQKRSRNLETLVMNPTDNLNSSRQDQTLGPQIKRCRQESIPSTSANTSEIEYQVPTSSQRDQDEEVIHGRVEVVDCDEGNNLPRVVGEDFEQYVEMDEASYEDVRASNNEVEVNVGDDSTNLETSIQNRLDISTNQQHSEATSTAVSNRDHNLFVSRSSVAGAAHRSRQQTQQLLLSQQSYEDGGDDCIVPSTPTLFTSRRSDSFGESINSVQVPQSRFTFGESSASTSVPGVQTHHSGPSTASTEEVFSSAISDLAQIVHEGMDDTRIDLTQLEDISTGCSVPTTPHQISPSMEQSNLIVRESVELQRILPDISQSGEKLETTYNVSTPSIKELITRNQEELVEVKTELLLSNSNEQNKKKDKDESEAKEEEVNTVDDSEIPEVTSDDNNDIKETSQEVDTMEENISRQNTIIAPSVEESLSPIRGATARRSARTSFRAFRGTRPTPIIWDSQSTSRGSSSSRGHIARGSMNDGQRARSTRGRRVRSKYYNY